MTFDSLVELVGDIGWFDLPALAQMADERRESLQVQLHRWCAAGKVLRLRRGMYALSERYRSRHLVPAELANHLYAPSYISSHWALSYYGLIPEQVTRYTSVTRRKTARFDNDFGVFAYQSIKADAFFGYRAQEMSGARVCLAESEKALLDHWYLEVGVWTRARMEGMRFQGWEHIDSQRLLTYAARFNSPRVEAAASLWLELRASQEAGIEL